MDEKQSTGSEIFDSLLHGGYEKGVITTIYGPSASGKSNLCLSSISPVYSSGKKIIFIDTENSFSANRFMQLNPDLYEKMLDYVIILRAQNYNDLKNVFSKLPELFVQEDIGLVVVDGIATHYRVELARGDRKGINSDFSVWVSMLNEIAYRYNIPILLTSQVYSDFTQKDKVNIIGGDLLKYGSKCLIELSRNDTRRATIIKHRSLPDGNFVEFEIWNEGLFKLNKE